MEQRLQSGHFLYGPWTDKVVCDGALKMRRGETVTIRTTPAFVVTMNEVSSAGVPMFRWFGGSQRGQGSAAELVEAMNDAGALEGGVVEISDAVLDEGAARDHVLKVLKGGEWRAVTDAARGYRGHFKNFQRAVSVLIKQGKVKTKMDSREGPMIKLVESSIYPDEPSFLEEGTTRKALTAWFKKNVPFPVKMKKGPLGLACQSPKGTDLRQYIPKVGKALNVDVFGGDVHDNWMIAVLDEPYRPLEDVNAQIEGANLADIWPKDVQVKARKWEERAGPKQQGLSKPEYKLHVTVDVKGKKYDVATPWLVSKDDEKEWLFVIKGELSKFLRKGKADRVLSAKTLRAAASGDTALQVR